MTTWDEHLTHVARNRELEQKLRSQGFKIAERGLRVPPLQQWELTEPPSGLVVRSFVEASATAKGREVEIYCAPYAKATRVADELPDGRKDVYVEELIPGCFSEACADPLGVELNINHKGRPVGVAHRLDDRVDGLHGTFHLMGSRRDVSLTVSKINSGHLGAASVEFVPQQTRRTTAGVVQRVQCELTGVALCPRGAYAEARVVAARSAVGQVLGVR